MKLEPERLKEIMDAARQSLETKVQTQDVADSINVSRHLITLARLIIRFGTPQQQHDAVYSPGGIRTIADEVRKSLSKEQIATQRDRTHNAPRRKQPAQVTTWSRLGPALRALSELPKPSDMVSISHANHMREKGIDQFLGTALKWLEEFNNEWLNYKLSKSQDSNANTGRGDTTTRTQHRKSSTG